MVDEIFAAKWLTGTMHQEKTDHRPEWLRPKV